MFKNKTRLDTFVSTIKCLGSDFYYSLSDIYIRILPITALSRLLIIFHLKDVKGFFWWCPASCCSPLHPFRICIRCSYTGLLFLLSNLIASPTQSLSVWQATNVSLTMRATQIFMKKDGKECIKNINSIYLWVDSFILWGFWHVPNFLQHTFYLLTYLLTYLFIYLFIYF